MTLSKFDKEKAYFNIQSDSFCFITSTNCFNRKEYVKI